MDLSKLQEMIVAALVSSVVTGLIGVWLRSLRGDAIVTKSRLLAAIGGGLVAGAVFYALVWPVVFPKCPPGTQVSITSPNAGDEVSMRVDVQGASQNLCAGHQIRIVVIPPDTPRYYPQAGAASIQPNGNWFSAAPALLGVEGETKDIGKKFEILAIVADRKAQRALDAYVRSSEEIGGSFGGMEGLPDGAYEHDRVTVTRTS